MLFVKQINESNSIVKNAKFEIYINIKLVIETNKT